MAFKIVMFRIAVVVTGLLAIEGCQFSSKSKQTVLPAPAGTIASATRHNDEGILAYQQQQWQSAKQHFEAALGTSPELAEAHYNLGMTLYRLNAMQEGDAHFIKAANLAPGNKVIWDAPPLKNANVPDKEVTTPGMSSDGHMHSH